MKPKYRSSTGTPWRNCRFGEIVGCGPDHLSKIKQVTQMFQFLGKVEVTLWSVKCGIALYLKKKAHTPILNIFYC